MLVNEVITEGKHDPNIFKAIFMMGSPGSGKTTVAKKIAAGTGLKMVNSDSVYEWLTIGSDMPIISKGYEDELYKHSHRLIRKQMNSYIDGRLGMIIDSTGKNPRRILELKERLEKLGYETMAVYVNVDIETALNRNEERRRKVDPNWVREKHAMIKNNLGQFQNIFKGRLVIVDNSEGANLDQTIPFNVINRFINRPPRMPQARQWLGEGKLDPRGETYAAELVELADLLKKNAQPWLSTVGVQPSVYRGIQEFTGDYAFIRAPRPDRKPLTSPPQMHNLFNEMIEDKGLVANRSNSTFVSGDKGFADGYGVIYVVIPLGEFHYTWAEGFKDWYVRFMNVAKGSAVSGPDYVNYDEVTTRLSNIRNTNHEGLKALKQELYHNLRGDDGSILEAIKSGSEIMLNANSLVHIHRNVWIDLLQYYGNDLGL